MTEPTSIEGISYFTPADGFVLQGRDGRVRIPWDGMPPVPLLHDDYEAALKRGAPDYDSTGSGIHHALRLNPECAGAPVYADILKESYPHIVAEIANQAVMIEAKDVDSPYLDRQITSLRIISLMEPRNSQVRLEIARIYLEKGTRLQSLNHTVQCHYAAERFLNEALVLDPADSTAAYLKGETLYTLGRYDQAAEVWMSLLPRLQPGEKNSVDKICEEIRNGDLPRVPPLDYLTALGIALEERQFGDINEAAAIIEDVIADDCFVRHYPMKEFFHILGECYQELGMPEKAAEAFRRS